MKDVYLMKNVLNLGSSLSKSVNINALTTPTQYLFKNIRFFGDYSITKNLKTKKIVTSFNNNKYVTISKFKINN